MSIFLRSEKLFLFICAGLGGLLSGLALIYGWVFFMWLGIALLWLASVDVFAGFLWGFVVVLISHSWLLALHPLNWIGVPTPLSLPIAIAIWMFCGGFGGFLVGLWSWLANTSLLLGLRNGAFLGKLIFALFLSSVWGLAEVVLAHYPLFWIGVGGSVLPADRFLAGLAKWIGAGGLATVQLLIGFWLWQTAFAFGRGIRWRKPFFLGLCLVIFAHLIGSSLLSKNYSPESISLALWQPDIPIRTRFSYEKQNSLPQEIQEALQKAKDLSASFLVAPEGMLNANQELLSPAPIPFLAGGFRWVKGEQRSALLVFDKGETTYSSALDKYRLVPLGERVPNFSQFPKSGLSAVGGLEPGTYSRLLSWSGPPLAGAICYELSDGHALAEAVKGGAQWILAIANLDPYPISLQRQFVALSQLRSIETERNLISVANTGPSISVLASGEVQSVIPPFREGTELAEITLNRDLTGYARWQEAPLIALFLISLFGISLIWLWGK
ncbi:apolipoprotein N-acyltransferase [Prochlorococcus sp. MIT 1307]|uniref:apolipoprotein N-acyltransferase n=1 Tax=Prochlorococcus sp. MIT 1307 TaxID=3096219 RepID=UPI002A765E77|nr:apolipoprotein N-acyltransferase [Prochlorococcus sp. MIT 1307]